MPIFQIQKRKAVTNGLLSQFVIKLFVKILFFTIFLSLQKSVKASEHEDIEAKTTILDLSDFHYYGMNDIINDQEINFFLRKFIYFINYFFSKNFYIKFFILLIAFYIRPIARFIYTCRWDDFKLFIKNAPKNISYFVDRVKSIKYSDISWKDVKAFLDNHIVDIYKLIFAFYFSKKYTWLKIRKYIVICVKKFKGIK